MMFLQPRPVNEIMLLESPQTRIDMIVVIERLKRTFYELGQKLRTIFDAFADGFREAVKIASQKFKELSEIVCKCMNSIEFKRKKPHRPVVYNYDRNYLKHSSVHGKQNHNKMIKYRRKHR